MATRPPLFRPRPTRTKQERGRDADRRRGSARSRGYGRPWEKASKSHLSRSPLCRYCELEGVVTAATLTDHLFPQQTYDWVFWITVWWVSSCDACHNGFKQAVERRGLHALNALARRLGLPTLDAHPRPPDHPEG